MEGKARWVLLAAVAPILWGANYHVTREFLPADNPLWGSVFRALPAGVVLLAAARRLPRRSWWWRSAVLGTLNIGAFFTLLYVASQRLQSGIASTLMASSAVAMMLLAWLLLSERPPRTAIVGAVTGIGGVAVMLLAGPGGVDPIGVTASLAAMAMSSTGFILTKRWSAGEGMIAVTAWQLVAGGIILTPVAVVIEGALPRMDKATWLAFAYVTLAATAVAYAAWFTGLRHLRAATVAVVGLLNPVTGVLMGALVAAEALTARQLAGAALVVAGVAVGNRRRDPRTGSVQVPRFNVGLRSGTARVPSRPPASADTACSGTARHGRPCMATIQCYYVPVVNNTE